MPDHRKADPLVGVGEKLDALETSSLSACAVDPWHGGYRCLVREGQGKPWKFEQAERMMKALTKKGLFST